MADELLGHIIRLENEIQEQLQAEQELAGRWLERVRAAEDQRLSHAEQGQDAADRAMLDATRYEAEREAAESEERVRGYCKRLENIADHQLEEVLRRHLLKVLPGASR